MSNTTETIADLLLQTGKAHHTAFFDVDGDDPDWPLWYAEYLLQRLPPLLDRALTVSELTHLMIESDRRYRAEEPDSPWHSYYAQFIVNQYLEPGTNQSGIPLTSIDVPALTTSQMIEVDRAMIDDYQINLTQMMENAGRNLAHLARLRFLDKDPRGKNVVVLAGSGGNGGGALAAARRLANYGAHVLVVTTRTAESFQGVPAQQLQILQKMGVPVYQEDRLEVVDGGLQLIIDGMIGYSLRGAPLGSAANLIRWANNQDVPILALDIPSGVDGTTGLAHDPSIAATATMTLALPKTGLLKNQLAQTVGELYVADISVPPALYAEPELNLKVGPIFARSDIIRLR